MARKMKRLSAVSLRASQKLGPGMYPDGRSLYLQVKHTKTGVHTSWIFRFMLNKRARHMGLGPFPDVPLAEARDKADECRRLLRDGTDPINARLQHRQETEQSPTFKDCAERYINSHKAGWSNAKHAAQWGSTLATYAYPVFGSLQVQAIDARLVRKALDPIWRETPETASRLRQRIEAVLDWAKALGYRTGDNPARWRGHLDKLLPKRSKVRAVKHHAAMPYKELPKFFGALAKRDTISAKAMLFTILTAARSGETRGAILGEIDRDAAIWIVPGNRTKSGREHRVPLTDETLAILDGLDHLVDDPNTVLFPNSHGQPLSDTAMRKYLQSNMWMSDLTVHGFRSTFRDWTAERTRFPREIAEAALAHVLKDKTEAAYQRGDLLDRRRKLMEVWGEFCTSGEAPAGKKVVPIREAG